MPIMQGPPGPYTVIDGNRFLYFAGTSYHALHGHPQVLLAAQCALEAFGLGTATSRSMFGNSPPTLELEATAARFFSTDDAFYFATGYSGDSILLSVLADTFEVVFLDEACHYSAFDAAKSSGKPCHTFAHISPLDLREQLANILQPGERAMILSDGIFAAKGSIVPLAEYVEVLSMFPGSAICIDDAHAVGVLGPTGKGSIEHAGLWSDQINSIASKNDGQTSSPQIYMCGTLSKAFGGYGGIIPGSHAFLEMLRANSKFYKGASAPPAPAAAAGQCGMTMVSEDRSLLENLRSNVQHLRTGLRKLGLQVEDSPSPIISLELGSRSKMESIAARLRDAGVIIAYTQYAGIGPEGGLRIAVFSAHPSAMIDTLLTEFARVLD